MYNVRSNCTLSYLHHGYQGLDVGKFKSEFPSDFSLVSRTTCLRLDVYVTNHVYFHKKSCVAIGEK